MTTTEVAQDYLGSASSLIKALKAPTDPPQSNWPTKVDIALKAWRTNELYLPRKAEVLRDWVLETLTRTQAKSTQSNAVLDPRYYDLLRLTWQDAPQTSPAPLSLLSTLFNAATHASEIRLELLGSSSKAFELLYRNQRQVKIDAWIEVWKSCLAFLASDRVPYDAQGHLESLASLVQVVMGLWRPNELGGDAQVKKVTANLYDSLPTLIKASSLHPEIPTLQQYRLLLPVPILREQEPLKPILSSLTSLPVNLVDFTAGTSLPQLLHTFIDQLQKHRYQVFTQPSSSKKSFEVFVSDKLRAAVQSGFKAILDDLDRASRSPDVSAIDLWEGRARLWDEINRWGGYLESDEAWGALLQNEALSAKEALRGETSSPDLKVQNKVIELLDTLERMDHGRADLDTGVIAWCLAAPKHCHSDAEKLLSSVLRYHQLTFSLQPFFDLLNEAITTLFTVELDPDIVNKIYDLISSGPLWIPSFQAAIRSAVFGLSNPSMRIDILHSLAAERVYAQGDSDDTAKRKRKPSSSALIAASASLTSRLAGLLLPTGVTWEDDTMYDEGVGVLLSRLSDVEVGTSDRGTKKHKKSRKSESGSSPTEWTADILLAAKLRLIRSLERVNQQWKGDRPQSELLLGRLEDKCATTETRTEILSSLSQSLLLHTAARFGLTNDFIDRLIDVWLGALQQAEASRDSLSNTAWVLLEREGMFVFESFASDLQRRRLLEQIGGQLAHSDSSNAFWQHCERLLDTGSVWELRGIRQGFLDGLRDGLASESPSLGPLAILAHTPMAVVPRDIRESLSKHLSNSLLSPQAKSAEIMPAVEWLARIARDSDSVRWINPKILPLLLKTDMPKIGSALSDLVRGLTKYQLRQSDTSSLLVCLDQLQSTSFHGSPLITVELYTALLMTFRNASEIPVQLETKLRAVLQSIASKLARTLSSLVEALSESSSSGLVELAQLYAVVAQLLHRLDVLPPKTNIAKGLITFAADATALHTVPRISHLIIEIAHAEAGGRYSEQTLATFTLLNAVSPTEEGNNAFAMIMRQTTLEDFASAVESSIGALALQRKTYTPRMDALHSRMAIAHLKTIQVLIGIPLEGSGKMMRRVCVSLQDELARIVANGNAQEKLAAMKCLEQLVQARSRIVRSMDFAATCGVLCAVLRPNSRVPRAQHSHYDIFGSAISILRSTARLRADLIAECPTEVVAVISSVFALFLQPRRQYISSARARARVTSRWPPWLAESAPGPLSLDATSLHTGGLTATHAAQLSRLLTGLCQAKLDKPRNPARSGSSSIANSLVKHVPAILVAYCRAVGDQWGSISSEIRKELESGLWALCEVLTAGGRVDARGREGEGLGLPFGLGEGGEVEKEVWAALWLNWSKHRYQGKG